MTITIHFTLIFCAFVCELLASIGVSWRINLCALGLAFYFLSILIGVR